MRLEDTYVHLTDDGRARTIPVTEDFWPSLMEGSRPELDRGRLAMSAPSDADWTSWEMHPAGEELVTLISGEVDFVLDEADGERTVPLRAPGEFVLVPRGVWHTANVRSPAVLLFVTPGAGTQHRPR